MSRIIKIAKIGEQYREIVVEGAITYRTLLKLAGYDSAESVMVENRGAVILDEPIADSVTKVVVSMPKIAGGVLPAGLRVVDDTGTEWRPVNTDNDDDDDDDDDNVWDVDDDDDFVSDDDDDNFMDDDEDVNDDEPRIIKVAQIGKPYAEISVIGAITYRALLKLAGYSGADGVYAEGRGSVILDEPVDDNVTNVVVNMPKIAGGTHQ